MTKKKTDEKDAEVAKTQTKKTSAAKEKEPTVKESTKDSNTSAKEPVQSSEIEKTSKDTSKEKESLKSKENQSKDPKQQAEDQAKLKAVAYNNGFGTSFRKLDKKISIEKLQSREDVPSEIPVNAEFLMDNAQVFNYAESQLTHRFENETLESIK